MDVIEKLRLLGTGAKYDMCGCGRPPEDDYINNGIYTVKTSHGTCSIFKVLLSNECIKDCAYCQNRVQRDTPRTTMKPEDLAKIFMQLYKKKRVQGIFLSSGIRLSVQKTMDDLIKTAEILRYRYRYEGYIHLKILPGATPAHIEAASRVANRLSINLEVPSANRLQKLSRTKKFETLMEGMKQIYRLRSSGVRISQTTQFVVGAADETDKEIIHTAWQMQKRFSLARIYFSAFRPVMDTPLENKPAVPLLRETRLYQADFLLRQYGFTPEHLVFDKNGQLLQDVDPKTAFALNNPHLFPIEINRADYITLLKVPGIGPLSAKRIISIRKNGRITSLEALKATGAVVSRALPFITVDGRYYSSTKTAYKKLQKGHQMSIFELFPQFF